MEPTPITNWKSILGIQGSLVYLFHRAPNASQKSLHWMDMKSFWKSVSRKKILNSGFFIHPSGIIRSKLECLRLLREQDHSTQFLPEVRSRPLALSTLYIVKLVKDD